jgi:hypothetical protein
MNNNLIIAGCNFIGLYSAIKCVENGYNVTIIERKSSYYDKKNYYRIFNKNHTLYINLLNKFSINYSRYNLKYNDKTYSIILNVINKSKLIPKKSLNNQSFLKFCRFILTPYEYNILKTNIDDFEHIYDNVSVMFAITLFMNDINSNVEYYIIQEDISELINKMLSYLLSKNVKILYNTDIKDIIYKSKVYISTAANTYIANILIITFSKNNLLKFKFINKEQKKLLNNVSRYYMDSEKIFSDIKLQNENEIKEHLLDNIHIVCPIKKYTIDLWNIGVNNIMIKDKIKLLFNHIYICNDSYSKNPFFVNYTIETFDDVNNKIITKLYKN